LYPEPEDPKAYEERLRASGGVDLFLAASGTSDGHVAFNPIGATLDERTRVIRLSTATRRDNLETFPGFGSLGELPRFGVGVGLGTIVEQSRRVVLVMTGTDKRGAVLRLRRCSDFTPDWPASFIYRCQNPMILLDRFASPIAELP
jgi:glucosamine-6-phosphate deaminase